MPGGRCGKLGGVPKSVLTEGGCFLDSELSTIHLTEAIWKIPQGPGAAPRETGPLLPPACS